MFLKDRDGDIVIIEDEDIDDKLEPEHFLTKEEIVKDIPSRMNDVDLRHFGQMEFDSLITLHHSMGMWIRNQYGLWNENNPFIDVNADGDSPKHADNYSFTIIEDLYESLNQ